MSNKLADLLLSNIDANYILIHGRTLIYESNNAHEISEQVVASARFYVTHFKDTLIEHGIARYKEYIGIDMSRICPAWHREPLDIRTDKK